MTLAYIYSSDSICWLKYILHWGIIYEQHFPVNLDTVTHIFRYHEYIFEESKEHSTYNGCRDIHHHWKNKTLIYKSNLRFSCFFSFSNNSPITRGILDKPRGNTTELSKNKRMGQLTMQRWKSETFAKTPLTFT